MSIKFILNGSETLFSLDKLPESLSLLKSAIINLFDFPEEVIEKDVKLFFKDEDGDKVNLEDQNDFESLKNEPLKAILIEIDPIKLDQKPGPDVFPLIFDDGPGMEGLEPVVRAILEKRLKEIVPKIAERLDAYYKVKYMNQQKAISESHTQTLPPENFSVESQTNSPEKNCNTSASQTQHLDMAVAGVQTFIEKREVEVQKSLAKQMEAQMQTEALMGLAEEFKAKEDLNKGKEDAYFKPLSPKQNAPKKDSKKPSPIKNPEPIMKVELVLLEVMQKNITIRDKIIQLKVVVQNTGELTVPKKTLGLKIPEKYFLAGEAKMLDELKPNEIMELVYEIKNPGADGKFGGLLDLYHKENMKVLHSLHFEFEVKEDRFHGFSGEVVQKMEQMIEVLGDMDDLKIKRILEFFRDNKNANVDAAIDRYLNGGFNH